MSPSSNLHGDQIAHQGLTSKEYQPSLFNSIWWTGSLGYLALYPLWCILLGRILLLR